LANAGDSNAKVMFESFGWHLGKLIQAVLYAYDPELIVIGGSVSLSFPFFKEDMYRSLNDGFIFPNSLKNLKIEVSELQNVAIYGAASLAIEKSKR
jgi:glucokinase